MSKSALTRCCWARLAECRHYEFTSIHAYKGGLWAMHGADRLTNIMSLFSGADREGREFTGLGHAVAQHQWQLPTGRCSVGCSPEDADCFVRHRKRASNSQRAPWRASHPPPTHTNTRINRDSVWSVSPKRRGLGRNSRRETMRPFSCISSRPRSVPSCIWCNIWPDLKATTCKIPNF